MLFRSKQYFFSYNIYGFAINRIYKKNYNMYIAVFRWGSRSSRSHFSNVKTKAVASDSRKKTRCAMSSITASFVAAKKSFRDVLLDLIGINFRICGISINPGHPDDIFDIGYVSFERSSEAAICRGAAGGASVAIM